MTLDRLAAAATLAAASLGAHAADAVAPTGNPRVRLEVLAQASHYLASERIGGVELNQDRGSLAGAGLAVAVNWPAVTGHVQVRQLRGDIAYRGYTQLGLPLRTETALDWQDWQARVGPTARLSVQVGSVGADLGVGQLVVRRAIGATGRSLPLTETLHLSLVSAGGDWRWAVPGGGQVHARLQWQHALTRRLAVDSGVVLDPYDLRPRRAHWASAAAGLQWPLTTGLALVATLEHSALRVDDAPGRVVYRQGQPAGLSSYPGSQQRLQTLAIGLQLAL